MAKGDAYLEAARRILAQLDDAEQQIADQGYPRAACASALPSRLVLLLEEYNPGGVEVIHALFAGGPAVPARLRLFIDFLAAPQVKARGNRLRLRPDPGAHRR